MASDQQHGPGPAGDEDRRAVGRAPAKGGRLRSIVIIVIFDVGAPLVAYKVLRSAGLTAVEALVLSGVFPALGWASALFETAGWT